MHAAIVDHLVYATPDLDLGIERLENLLGVRATPGGQHRAEGTRNALIALGPTTYIEIVGPDPEQPEPEKPRWFRLDDLRAPTLVTWAAKSDALERLASEAERLGVKLGDVVAGSRQRRGGVLLSWRYTNPRTVVADGIIPFFIDWGQTSHPAQTAAPGASLVGLHAEHPDADRVQRMAQQLGLDFRVRPGPRPALIATLSGLRGEVELR